jgi:UDP-N-acetylmuramoylalanine--D-glutamate ligase
LARFKLEEKRVAVLGAGRSGLAAVRLLKEHGAGVFLSDHREIPSRAKEELEALDVTYEEGGHTSGILENELIVLSPGVPPCLPILKEARERGISIIGELELAYRLCKSKRILAVTGTNGKSTTTKLIGELLRAAGDEVVVAGNIGNPLSGELGRIDQETAVVLEVSSFQLETIEEFHPWVSIFLNFAPDHLERHGSIECYFKTKCRIFENQTQDDFALVHPSLVPLLPPLRSRVLKIDDKLVPKRLELFPHQREDLAAALLAARLVDPRIDLSLIDLGRALALPHRLEFVAEIDGIRFYDDSKATNVAATLAAIDSFPGKGLTLILGGQAKGESFSPLAKAIKKQEIATLLIGEAAGEIAQELERVGWQNFRFIGDFQEAVREALALRREVCLLSPACASFDMFSDYRERGLAFQQAVRGPQGGQK